MQSSCYLGSYKWADGKSVSTFDATVVRVETNHGKFESKLELRSFDSCSFDETYFS